LCLSTVNIISDKQITITHEAKGNISEDMRMNLILMSAPVQGIVSNALVVLVPLDHRLEIFYVFECELVHDLTAIFLYACDAAGAER
jgi:hypothetical protein